ncbi:MAG TPA: PAAR domain-containing protein [Panacibacter sp.]|nr:PAAR domain-containing protein [Panacibacter sp.]
MGNPAARIGDMHTCPMSDGPKPHVGGPILPIGVPNVLIGGIPAAVIGNMCTCIGPPDAIVMGSTSVIIGGRFASRQNDNTAHGGIISIGLPTVLIGGPASVSLSITLPQKGWWGNLLQFLGIKAEDDGVIKYGEISIKPDPNNPEYQSKVLGDLIMIDNTPTGKKLLKSLNDAGGAIISVGESKTKKGNRCWPTKTPPEIEYNPDKETIGPQPWLTRPPAIGLAHEIIHADHGANGTLYTGSAPNDSKPNPGSLLPPTAPLEELHTAGIPPNDSDPFTENKIRSEWYVPQPQRQWY